MPNCRMGEMSGYVLVVISSRTQLTPEAYTLGNTEEITVLRKSNSDIQKVCRGHFPLLFSLTLFTGKDSLFLTGFYLDQLLSTRKAQEIQAEFYWAYF